MTIREYAKSVNHEVVGKLTRQKGWRWWIDEAGNEYGRGSHGFFIVTVDGNVI